MTRVHALLRSALGRFVVAMLGLFWLVSLSDADAAKDSPAVQQEKQQHVQAETERTVRRMSTMVRLLVYNQLDKAAETKLLDEVAQTLAGLSKDQMNEIIARLEVAARVP